MIDISNFINWFITQVVNIGRQVLNLIDNIMIYQNVSMLDLIITIIIIGMFLNLILTIPNNAMSKAERNIKESKRRERNDK